LIFLTLYIIFSIAASTRDIAAQSSGLYLFLISYLFLILGLEINIKKSIFCESIFLLILILTIVGYGMYRVNDELSSKVGNANANFVGVLSILLLFHILITKMHIRSFGMFLICLTFALTGAFFSSSRVALILIVLFLFLLSIKQFNFATVATVVSLLFGLFILNLVLQNPFFNEQVDHIFNRFINEEISADGRVAQILFLINILLDNPFYFLVPIDHSLTENIIGVGFSDNSFLEVSSYVGLLASLVITFSIFFKIYKHLGGWYLLFFMFLYLLFNIILWLPFILLFIASGLIYNSEFLNITRTKIV